MLPVMFLSAVSAVAAPATGMIGVWTQPMSAQLDLLLEAAVGAFLLTAVLYALANVLTQLAVFVYRRMAESPEKPA